MKTSLIVASLFVCWNSGWASELPRIQSLSREGILVFEYDDSQTHWSLEWTQDLSDDWIPSGIWNMLFSESEQSVVIPLSDLPKNIFFRLTTSSDKIQPQPSSIILNADKEDWGKVTGKVLFWEGDFMPGDGPTGTITPVGRIVCFFEPTLSVITTESTLHSFVLSPFVSSTESDENGDFSMELPPGVYSVIVMEKPGVFYASTSNDEAYLPVNVIPNDETVVRINIKYLATF